MTEKSTNYQQIEVSGVCAVLVYSRPVRARRTQETTCVNMWLAYT